MRRYVRSIAALGMAMTLAISTVALANDDAEREGDNPWRDCSGGYVALTFDDGPSPTLTPLLLLVLRRHGIRATFFVLGAKVVATPNLVHREAVDGHSVQDHSWDHPDLTVMPIPAAMRQLTDAANAIVAIGVPRPRFYRPPYNRTTPEIRQAAQQLGLTEVGLTVDSDDWEDPGVPAIVANTLTVTPGGIVNMHDTHQQTIEAIDAIATGLKVRHMCPGRLVATNVRNPAAPPYLTFFAKADRW